MIIVSYNVKYFLEQCLFSLQRAGQGLQVEVIVVDNQSSDGSLTYLEEKFPGVRFVLNKANEGFAKACNRGLALATGQYILFLNPDTLLSEDTLHCCLRFFAAHPEAGAVGVRMVDGSGRFLKESKRAFPAPLTSLFKLMGLTRLFPHSKVFSRYYLGHLSEHRNQEVDVLAGAFMMIRRSVLDAVGSFDEAFFMYGEDIDLSYRIQKEGWKNCYLAETSIIHFKGESTKKGSFSYVHLFYKAMHVFVNKHYRGTRAGLFRILLQFAIWLRALLAGIARFVMRVGLPFADALLILGSFWLVKEFWSRFVKTDVAYEARLLLVAFPVFTGLYLLTAYYAGLYSLPYRPVNLKRSTAIATLVLLAGYALLPEHYRFSRGIVLFGALLAFALLTLLRHLLVRGGLLPEPDEKGAHPYILVAGTADEFAAVHQLLHRSGKDQKIIGRLSVDEDADGTLAAWTEVGVLDPAAGARELVFCAGKLSFRNIIAFIQSAHTSLRYRFYSAGSYSIVGSDSSDASGEVLAEQEAYNLSKLHHRRVKRLVDVLAAFLLLLLLPLHLILLSHPLRLLKNCLLVLAGKRTWVGYHRHHEKLPFLPEAVLTTGGKNRKGQHLSAENFSRLDYWYARNYEPLQDVRILLRNYKQLQES